MITFLVFFGACLPLTYLQRLFLFRKSTFSVMNKSYIKWTSTQNVPYSSYLLHCHYLANRVVSWSKDVCTVPSDLGALTGPTSKSTIKLTITGVSVSAHGCLSLSVLALWWAGDVFLVDPTSPLKGAVNPPGPAKLVDMTVNEPVLNILKVTRRKKKHISIHPSILYRLSRSPGQQPEQGSPHFPLASHFIQLSRGGSRGVPRPAERHSGSCKSQVFPGASYRWDVPWTPHQGGVRETS